MTESFPEPVSIGHTSEFCTGSPPAGENHRIRMNPLCSAAKHISSPVRLNLLYGEGTTQLDSGSVKPETENVQHAVG